MTKDKSWIDLNGLKVRLDDPSDVVYDFENDMYLRSDDRMYFESNGSIIGTDGTFRITKQGSSTDGCVRVGPVSSGGIGTTFERPTPSEVSPSVQSVRSMRHRGHTSYRASFMATAAFFTVAGGLLALNMSQTGEPGLGAVAFFSWPFAALSSIALIVDLRYAQGRGQHPNRFWAAFVGPIRRQ